MVFLLPCILLSSGYITRLWIWLLWPNIWYCRHCVFGCMIIFCKWNLFLLSSERKIGIPYLLHTELFCWIPWWVFSSCVVQLKARRRPCPIDTCRQSYKMPSFCSPKFSSLFCLDNLMFDGFLITCRGVNYSH